MLTYPFKTCHSMTYSSNMVYSVRINRKVLSIQSGLNVILCVSTRVTCLTDFGSEFPTSKWRNSSYKYTPATTLSFWVAAPRSYDLSPRFLSVGKLTAQAYSAPIAKERHFTNAYLCLLNHSQPPPDLCNVLKVHDQTCPCAHLSRWRAFCAFVVNCDWVNKMN